MVLVLLSAAFLTSSCILPTPSLITAAAPVAEDALLALYRNDRFKPLVVEYTTELTQSRTVALAVLETCDELNLDPALALAVAWNESQFNPQAIHNNPDSQDRGLFQLNSKTFAKLSRAAVFNPKSNARQGLLYLKRALDKLGSETKALGYYNSGIGLVTQKPLPRSTKAYVQRVLEDRDRFDHDAIAFLYFSHDTRLALR